MYSCILRMESRMGRGFFLIFFGVLTASLVGHSTANGNGLVITPPKAENFTVLLEFSLQRIYELNHAQEYIDLEAWLHMYWLDERLKWASTSDKGEYTRVSAGDIWTPNLYLFNDYGDVQREQKKDGMAIVYNTGHVQWVPPRRIKAFCPVNLRDFPFDEQECLLRFGLWGYSTREVDLAGVVDRQNIDLEHFLAGGDWDVSETRYNRSVRDYGIGGEPQAEIVYFLKLKRNREFFYNIFVIPAVLINLLIPFQYFLHPDAKERATFCTILLLSIIVLLMGLADYLSSGMRFVPRLVEFYIVTLVMIIISSVLSVMILHFYNRAQRKGRVPYIIRAIFLTGINRLFFVHVKEIEEEPEAEPAKPKPKEEEPKAAEAEEVPDVKVEGTEEPAKDAEGEEAKKEDESQAEQKPEAAESAIEIQPSESEPKAKVEPKKKDVTDLLNDIIRKMDDRSAEEDIRDEWRALGMVFDRLFFLIFFGMFVLYASALLYQ